MKEQIILVEDDPQQSASIKAAIERRYRNAEVELVETESELWERVVKMPAGQVKPRMVICDVMLPWAFPEPDAPKPPPEVVEGTFRMAGVRCWERFRKCEDLCRVPWIYFTVLDDKTIGFEAHSDDRTGYAQKCGSIKPLLERMDEFLHLDDDWLETDGQVTEMLMTSPEMRKTLIDGLNAPLTGCATSLP